MQWIKRKKAPQTTKKENLQINKLRTISFYKRENRENLVNEKYCGMEFHILRWLSHAENIFTINSSL